MDHFVIKDSKHCNGACSHDVTAAILVFPLFRNNEMAAMLVYQTNPVGVGVELFLCKHSFLFQ